MKVLLKEVRKARGLSQNKLAQKIGTTLQNIQKIEYGNTKGIQYDVLSKLCKVLDCQPGDLLVETPDNDNDPEVIAEQEKLGELAQAKKLIEDTSSLKRQRAHSFLSIVSKAPKSA